MGGKIGVYTYICKHGVAIGWSSSSGTTTEDNSNVKLSTMMDGREDGGSIKSRIFMDEETPPLPPSFGTVFAIPIIWKTVGTDCQDFAAKTLQRIGPQIPFTINCT